MGNRMMKQLTGLALQEAHTNVNVILPFRQGSHFFSFWSPCDCDVSPNLTNLPSFYRTTLFIWWLKIWKKQRTHYPKFACHNLKQQCGIPIDIAGQQYSPWDWLLLFFEPLKCPCTFYPLNCTKISLFFKTKTLQTPLIKFPQNSK